MSKLMANPGGMNSGPRYIVLRINPLASEKLGQIQGLVDTSINAFQLKPI